MTTVPASWLALLALLMKVQAPEAAEPASTSETPPRLYLVNERPPFHCTDAQCRVAGTFADITEQILRRAGLRFEWVCQMSEVPIVQFLDVPAQAYRYILCSRALSAEVPKRMDEAIRSFPGTEPL